jgi:hypothetical protein
MGEKIIAYCGGVCTDCPAYVATQADDREALEKVAAEWREQYDPNLTVEPVMCDGCLGTGRLGGYCGECPVRACAAARNAANCAHCADYACEVLEGFFGNAPHLRDALDEIRRSI